jgi:hypothetical protein
VWVEGGDIQDELLDRLGGVLAPPEELELTPSPAELEALAAAVSARWPGESAATGPAPAAEPSGSGGEVRRLRRVGSRTRRIGSASWRAGSVAAGIVLFSASAAAANGGVPMPRPVRVVAYSVGLPVDSPALDDTHQHIKDLNQAVEAKDKPKAEKTVHRLQTDLAKVPADEQKKAVPKVEAAIAAAATSGLIQNPPPASTTPTTTPPAASTTTVTAAPGPSTTATTAEEEREKDKDKAGKSTTTTAPPTTTTTGPETTATTGPEAQDPAAGTTGDPAAGDGQTPPDTTPTTVPAETTTTTTTAPPPDETTTTTTTVPESTTTTTAPAA